MVGRGQDLFLKGGSGAKLSAEQGDGRRITGILAGHGLEREKDLGEVRMGQVSAQEALLSRSISWRNNMLFSQPGLSVSPQLPGNSTALLPAGQSSAAEPR